LAEHLLDGGLMVFRGFRHYELPFPAFSSHL
jgi:hypothetical protein